jgi:hypothetical protein
VEAENKAIVRRFLEETAKGNLDVIDELLSPDFVDRSRMPGQGPTREDYKLSTEEIIEAAPTTTLSCHRQKGHRICLQRTPPYVPAAIQLPPVQPARGTVQATSLQSWKLSRVPRVGRQLLR